MLTLRNWQDKLNGPSLTSRSETRRRSVAFAQVKTMPHLPGKPNMVGFTYSLMGSETPLSIHATPLRFGNREKKMPSSGGIHAGKPDANKGPLVALARRIGAVVINMPRDAGFDCLICFRGQKHIVEFKDPEKPPSARKLTPGEAECRDRLEDIGVKYNVIMTDDDLLTLLGVIGR